VSWSMNAPDGTTGRRRLITAIWRLGELDALLHHSEQGKLIYKPAVSQADG